MDKKILLKMSSRSLFHLLLIIAGLVAIALHFSLKLNNIPLLIVIALGGIPIIFQIIVKLLKGDLGADLLAVFAFSGGIWLGEYLASLLIIMMLAGGQALEEYAMRKASSVLLALSTRMPEVVNRKIGNNIEQISLSDIAIGDNIVVFPHETSPIDGSVIEGNSSMDESYLTGEPYRISKTIGSHILSGSINGDGVLVVNAEKLATDSRYSQIIQVMREAEQKRPTIRRLGDKIGAIFAPLALIFALATWYFTGDSMRFLSVLVVATPCPLLIAIPITIISAISIAASKGIIIKDPTVLELLPSCRTAIFDKTGTLTYGKPELIDIFPTMDTNKTNILQFAASLERYSKHPLASAVLQAAKKENLVLLQSDNFSEKAGQGLTGIVAGHKIGITNRKKLLQTNPDISASLPPNVQGLECIVLMDDKYAASFVFRDAPRAQGKSFISHLVPLHNFNKIMLVSGDRESEVSYLAKLLGIKEAISGQSPEQKVEIVRAETAIAPTLFMGDGINDAPALSTATVGIAFGQNSSVTAEAAGAVIMENSLLKVDELMHISALMRRILLQSAIGGMILSIIAMIFAATGFINPVIGALLQEVIDALAIINALRLAWGSKITTDI